MVNNISFNGTKGSDIGIFIDDTAVSALLTPPPLKGYIESKSRLEHGMRVVLDDPTLMKYDSREITLIVNIAAPDEENFIWRYGMFCKILANGVLDITTPYIPGVVFHCFYESCTQFSQFRRGVGSFSLRVTEFNPNNRV